MKPISIHIVRRNAIVKLYVHLLFVFFDVIDTHEDSQTLWCCLSDQLCFGFAQLLSAPAFDWGVIADFLRHFDLTASYQRLDL